jgi:hypothetical protein
MNNAVRILLLGLLTSAMALGAACMTRRPDRDYVQTNVTAKALFEGEWYYVHTIVDHDFESAWSGAFVGEVSFDTPSGYQPNTLGTMARVRFVVDEDFLYAFRSYPVVADADRTPEGGRELDLYEPLAAWPIEEHFDIAKRYNPMTGEHLNVVEENSIDRPWYEREYIRVDWSANNITGSYNFNGLDVYDPLGIVKREAAGSFSQEGSPFREEWETRYEFTPVEEPPRDSWEWEYWDRYGSGELYHFSFVSQELWSPGVYPLLIGFEWMPATAFMVSVRHAFLRVPDEAQYEPKPLPENAWEQFGAWRVEQPTYAWGDLPDEEKGFTNFYGITDDLNYWGSRHNIWRRSFTYDDQNRPVPIPVAERQVQRVVYTLNAGFPAWLIQPAFDVVGEWNASLMASVRVARGQPLPANTIPGAFCSTDVDCTASYGTEYPFTSCRLPRDGGDQAQGQCTRYHNPFLTPDPSLGDYDCRIVDGSGRPAQDPGFNLDSFDAESLQSQRSWRFEGSECVLTLRNNTCDNPVDLERAIATRRECADNPALCCDQMGDLRFNILAHNPQPGVHWGGVSQPLMDPLTGELVQANANVSGTSIEGAMTYTGWFFNLVDGENDELDELSYMVGEDVRALMEETNYAVPPVSPAVPTDVWRAGAGEEGRTNSTNDARGAAANMMPRLRHALEQAWELRGDEGRAHTHSDRLYSLAGTPMEHRLHSGLEGMLSMGVMPGEGALEPSEAQLDQLSPFRRGVLYSKEEYQALRDRMASRCFYPSADQEINAFVDNSFVNWLQSLPENLSAQQRAVAVGRQYFRSVMLHEMGHSVGMRHNFAGSLDYHNYHDQYYHIEDQHPLPMAGDYDEDENGNLSYEELARFNSDLQNTREQRELAGVARWHNASIMEYMPRLANDLAPLGRYDRAFIHFIYGDQVEVYQQDPQERVLGINRQRPWLNRPDRADRSFEMYFLGGEGCRLDVDPETKEVLRAYHEDCPYGVQRGANQAEVVCASDSDCTDSMRCSAQGWCLSKQLPPGQVVGQVCGQNPRAVQTSNPENLPGVCLSYEESYTAYQQWVAPDDEEIDQMIIRQLGRTEYVRLANGSYQDLLKQREYMRRYFYDVFPVEYRFCTDDRTADISWCNRFDEGENFREIMNHYRDQWERRYPFANFRRYRWAWDGSSNFGTYADIAKVMSHFYYRVIYENLWQEEGDVWVDSMTDHMAGAAAGMNFLAEVVAQPDVGSYVYDETTDSYKLLASEVLGAGDIDIRPGVGRYMWSALQEGPYGIDRLERVGSHQDKIDALIALATRDWGYSYSYDERFWINFYAMFSAEMTQLYGGVILNDPSLYGARVCPEGYPHPMQPGAVCERTTVFYQDLWRGPFSTDPENPQRGNPYDDYYASLPAIGGGNNELLRAWAAVLSLAEFPIFYDTTYEQQLYLFVEGSGESFEFRDCADHPGDPSCLREGRDFVRYVSDRFNLSMVAMAVEPESPDVPESVDTAYVIVSKANELKRDIEACSARRESCPVGTGYAAVEAAQQWSRELEQTESYLFTLLELQESFGIASWL